MLFFILVILMFGLLVFVHELGHFILARRNGVEVEEFGFGFPPRVFGKKVGRTIYSINLLPLGGFVRLKGEEGGESVMMPSTEGTPAEAPKAQKGTFVAASTWAKTKILLAGVVMNLITAFVIFWGLALSGMPPLGQYDPKFLNPEVSLSPRLIVTEVEDGSPADRAGITRGDYITQANGERLTGASSLPDFTRANAGKEVSLTVQKPDGAERKVQVRLPEKSEGGLLGVGAQPVSKQKYSFIEAPVAAAYYTGELFALTVLGVIKLIISLPFLIAGLFSSGVPQAAQEAAGPLGIIKILQSFQGFDPAYFLLFTANISVALAGFNVLPLPALDGGRLAVILARKIPGVRISEDAEAKYHTFGFLALLGLVAVITVYDVRRFF